MVMFTPSGVILDSHHQFLYAAYSCAASTLAKSHCVGTDRKTKSSFGTVNSIPQREQVNSHWA
ncbi:MAG TPA: hypothetical protein VJY15_19490, partial [Candidatus Acidoferrum sp.]|nr:hypothetical protein [Candidatus Acidoferrum sp.]